MMNYIIEVEDPFVGEITSELTNDIQDAIEKWFEYGRKYPSCANIQADTKENALKLIHYANEHMNWIKDQYELGCIYTWEWIRDGIKKELDTGCIGFQWMWDSIFPFCMG